MLTATLYLGCSRRRRWLGPFALVLILVLVGFSERGNAENRQLGELAAPVFVTAGREISFTLVERKWLYVAADPSHPLSYRGYRNGTLAAGGEDTNGQTLLDAGDWNFTFGGDGRIAVASSLAQVCGLPATASNFDSASCPSLTVSEPTAFSLTSPELDRPYTLRIRGNITVSFFDRYLLPAGSAADRTFTREMMGLVVVAPVDTSAVSTISIVPASSGPDLSPILAIIAVAVVAVAAVTVVLKRVRMNRQTRSLRPDKKSPR